MPLAVASYYELFRIILESRYFSKSLHIGHRTATWTLESASMNVSAPYSGSRKTDVINGNGSEASAPVVDRAGADSDASQHNFAGTSLTGTQRARLINAACTAFFIRRGLDPGMDWHTRRSRQC